MTEKVIHFVDDYLGLQIATAALISLASAPVLIGSFCSLRTPRPSTRRATRSQGLEEEEEEEHIFHPKVITVKDTFLLPILFSGSVYLLSSLTHTVHPDYLNHLLTLCTGFLFTVVFSSTVLVILKNGFPSLFQKIQNYRFSCDSRDKRLCHVNVTIVHLLIYLISIGLSIVYIVTQHWTIENLFAISIAIHSIRYLTLQSFGTGFLLLLGMLAYDVFWVFGTNTLLDLSKLLIHAPTSVVWPRNINTYVLDKLLRSNQYFTMYGLGEIIIPGIFIAYALNYDQFKHHKSGRGHHWLFSKPYFTANFFAYVVSTAVAIYTVHFTKKSQSAFLFIVPALIAATTITALTRNEFHIIYDSSDILDTFRDLAGFTEEKRPSFEERLRTPRASRRSRSKSVSAVQNSGVVTEAFEETRKAVVPYLEEAVQGTKKVVEPYLEEAMNTTKKAINQVATKVQEQTTIEEDVIAEHAKRRVGRPRSTSRSKSAPRRRGNSKATTRKKAQK